ncbi:MAG: hypothetical protein QXE06_06970 [Candidatus Bathyarchaeia archaeon]
MGRVVAVAVSAAVLAMLVCLVLVYPYDRMVVYASPGDAFGNDIMWIAVYQGGALKANFTASGGSVRVDSGVQVDFVVAVKFNATLASSQSEAVQYTKVLMTISYGSGNYVWQNKELNNTSVSGPSNGFYWLKEVGNWTSNLPQAGVTYTCSITYQGYY